MQRRTFLQTAAASLLPSSLLVGQEPAQPQDQEIIDMQSMNRAALIALLDDEIYDTRQNATLELAKRGIDEIRKTSALLPWKEELRPRQGVSPEVRYRLRMILNVVGIEETKLAWKGVIIPRMGELDCDDPVPAIEYLTLLNQTLGGPIDMENYAENVSHSTEEKPTLWPAHPDESFWHWVARNDGIKMWDNQGALYVEKKQEDELIAYDGALCGKLNLIPKGISAHLMTDPGLELIGREMISATVIQHGVPLQLKYEEAGSPETFICAERDEELDMNGVTNIEMQLRILASPVARKTITDFSQQTTHTLGTHTLGVSHCMEGHDTEGKAAYFLRCQLYVPREAFGDPLPPNANKFFTIYGEDEHGQTVVQYAKNVGYERRPCGAEFFLTLAKKPTRMDARFADDNLMHVETRTLRYTLKH